MKAFRIYHIIDGDLCEDTPLPTRADTQIGALVGAMTNLKSAEPPTGPEWCVEIRLSDIKQAPRIRVPVETFLSLAEFEAMQRQPLCFGDVAQVQRSAADAASAATTPTEKHKASQYVTNARAYWFYRDGVYAIDRTPRPSEEEEAQLLVKALHYQRDDAMRRLREQVATAEAVDEVLKSGRTRRPIPDEIKLLVWARDGGKCVRCETTSHLHFDHVIPLALGGSDAAENLQLLCRSCNLKKGPKLV